MKTQYIKLSPRDSEDERAREGLIHLLYCQGTEQDISRVKEWCAERPQGRCEHISGSSWLPEVGHDSDVCYFSWVYFSDFSDVLALKLCI